GQYRSSLGKRYCKALDALIPKQVHHGPLFIQGRIFRPQDSGDLSNRLKVLEDALENVAWENDRQIYGFWWSKHVSQAFPRVEMLVTRFVERLPTPRFPAAPDHDDVIREASAALLAAYRADRKKLRPNATRRDAAKPPHRKPHEVFPEVGE